MQRRRGGRGRTFVKRIIGLPGDRWHEQNGYVYINGKKLDEPYVEPERRDADTIPEKTIPEGAVLHDGRQPRVLVRLAALGHGSAGAT